MSQVNKKSGPLLLVIGALGLFAIVGAAAWWMGRVVPPDLNAPPAELVKYVSTDAFSKLPLDQKKPYAEKLEEVYYNDPDKFDELPADQKDVVRRNVGGTMMDLSVSKYLSLKTPEERNKFLDEQVAKMQKRMASAMARKLMGKSAGPAGRPPFMPSKGFTADQQKNATENRDSVKMAAYMQLMHDVAARMEEKGLPIPGPFSTKK